MGISGSEDYDDLNAMSKVSGHPAFFRYLMSEMENVDMLESYKPQYSWAAYCESVKGAGISKAKLAELQQKKNFEKKKLAAQKKVEMLRSKQASKSKEKLSRSKSRADKYSLRDDEYATGYQHYEPIRELREARHSSKSIEKRKWRKQKKLQAKMNGGKVKKVDMLAEVQKGLEKLDLQEKEMGIKFEGIRRTVRQLAATLPVDRQCKDVRYTVDQDGLTLQVYHRGMQDDAYVINNNVCRVRNVTDKYCFFKALLNTLLIEGDDEEKIRQIYEYHGLVKKLFKETTKMRELRSLAESIGNIVMLDIGTVHEYSAKNMKKRFEDSNSVLVYVCNDTVGHFGYVEKRQCLTLAYVIGKLRMLVDVQTEEHFINYDYEVRAPQCKMTKIDVQKVVEVEQKLVQKAVVREEKKKGSKLRILIEDARQSLNSMIESTKDLENEKSWALFLFRTKNKMYDPIMPKRILSRQSFMIASSINKKKNVEWIPDELPTEIVLSQFDEELKTKLFKKKIQEKKQAVEMQAKQIKSRIERKMKRAMTAAVKMFRTVEPLPQADARECVRVNDIADDLCDMGRVCHAMPQEDYLQYLVTVGQQSTDRVCDAIVAAKNLAGGAFLGYLAVYVILFSLVYLAVLWRLKKPIAKYLLMCIGLAYAGLKLFPVLIPQLVCRLQAGHWSCSGFMRNEMRHLLAAGYGLACVYIFVYGLVYSILLYFLILYYQIKIVVRAIIKLGALSCICSLLLHAESQFVGLRGATEKVLQINVVWWVLTSYLYLLVFFYFLCIIGKFYRYRATFNEVKIGNYTPRYISQFVRNRLSASALLQIFSKPVDPTRAEGKCSGVKGLGSSVPRQLKVIPGGYLSKRYNEILNVYGCGFSTEELASGKIESNGLTHEKSVMTKILLRQLAPIFEEYDARINSKWISQQGIDFRNNPAHGFFARSYESYLTIYDTTFSYELINDIFRERYMFRPREVYCEKNLKKNLTPEMQTNLSVMWTMLDQQLESIEYGGIPGGLHAQILRMETTPVFDVGGNAVYIFDYFQKTASENALKRHMIYEQLPPRYVPVIVPGSPADRKYQLDTRYNLMRANPVGAGRQWFNVGFNAAIESDLEKVSMVDDDLSVLLMLGNSHTFKYTPGNMQNVRVICVDEEFCRIPGHYLYAQGEGSFNVFRRNGHAAVHVLKGLGDGLEVRDVIRNRSANMRLDFGWYSYVGSNKYAADTDIQHVVMPKLTVENELSSVQKDFFKNYIIGLGPLSKEKSFATVKEMFLNAPDHVVNLGRVNLKNKDTFVDFCLATHNYAMGKFTVSYYSIKNLILAVLYFLLDWSVQYKLQEYGAEQYSQQKTGIFGSEWIKGIRKDDEDDDDSQRVRKFVPYNERQYLNVMMGAKFEKLQEGHKHGNRMQDVEALPIIKEYVGCEKKTKGVHSAIGAKYGVEQETFFCKPTPPVKRVPDYMCDQQYRQLSDATVQAVNEWLKDHPTPEFYGGIDRTTGISTKTGYSLISDERQYEWSSRCVHHAIYALYHRQLACNLYPTEQAVVEFGQTIAPWFKRFTSDFAKELDKVESFDAYELIKLKNFQKSKKLRYVQNLRRLLVGQKQAQGCFTTMVKSGQVYFAKDFEKVNGFLVDKDDRPRNIMVPSESLCGMLCALQTVFWKPLKKVLPSFIQGLTKKQLKQMLKDKLGSDWKAVCIDGSAFDSTQNAINMEMIDTTFFVGIKQNIRKLLIKMKEDYPNSFIADVDKILDIIIGQATNLNNFCFTEVPGIKRVHWPDQVFKIFMENYRQKVIGRDREWIQTHYIVNVIRGTTFSGHPTKTTLGNTLRSICYAYFYLVKAGIKNPWDNPNVYVIAAGDDVVIFCKSGLEFRIEQSILTNTSRFKGTESQFTQQGVACGLGQCVKTVLVVDWYNFDFCSKWSFGSTFADFDMTRDIKKLLTTRQYYTKENADILSHPVLHAQAILQSVESEHVSHLIQDLLRVRVLINQRKYGKVETSMYDLSKICDKLKYSFGDEYGYLVQHQVNQRVGVDLKTLIDLWESQYLNTSMGGLVVFSDQAIKTINDVNDDVTIILEFQVKCIRVSKKISIELSEIHKIDQPVEVVSIEVREEPPQQHNSYQLLTCCY